MGTDTPLESGSVVVLPMKIKAAEGAPADLRASFGIYIGEVVPENAALEVRAAIPGLESEGKIAAAPVADVPAPAKAVKEKKGTLPTPPPPSEPDQQSLLWRLRLRLQRKRRRTR